jgi:hypothetical protein
MSKPSQNGKGKRPIIGYNDKNWYENWDKIDWKKPKQKQIKKDKM